MAEETTVSESMIGKITMSSIGTRPSKVTAMDGDNAECSLARIYGQLSGMRDQFDKDKNQTYRFFTGTFEAVNMQDGEVYQSGKLFLPKGISELVENAVTGAVAEERKRLGKDDGADPAVQVDFAFEVRSIKAKNPIGYSYKVLALKNPAKIDQLAALRQLVQKAGAIDTKRLTGTQRGTGPQTIEGGKAKTA